MKRRLFSLFLALTLVVGMLPAPAFAQETEPTQATEAPIEAPAPTEAPAAEPAQAPTEAPKATEAPAPTEAPAETQPVAPTEDEAVAAVQAMIDALPDRAHMSESYIDALEAAYSAYETLTAAQQAQITGAERMEALFDWVNSQTATQAVEATISGDVTWDSITFNTSVKLTGATTLTLEGVNKIECDSPLDLNGYNLTIKGTGTLEVVGDGRSKEYQCNGAIFDSTYTGRTASAGTLYLEGGTVKTSGGTHNAISLYAVDLKGGSLEAYGGVRSGLACSYLYARSGSIYATGGVYGIYAAVFRGAYNLGNLDILASDEKDAQLAEMDSSDIDDINDNAKKKTCYIGKVTGPLFGVKSQQGYLYEGLADQTVTFPISYKNLGGYGVYTSWEGDHTGLNARTYLANNNLTVTADDTVKEGTYTVVLTVRHSTGGNTDIVFVKNATVTVSGPPVTVTTQPQDTSAKCLDGDVDSWQGDDEVQVAGTLAEGLSGDISYQWKLKDGTVLDGFTDSTVTLKDLYQYLSGEGKLTKQTDKPWLSTAKVYCTLSFGSYSVDSDTVTMTVNTCKGERVNHDGSCKQCGEFHRQDPLLVDEDGYFTVVPDESAYDPAFVGPNLVKGGTFYLTKDLLHRGLDAAYTPAGSEDVTLDLQGHTLELLKMGNFPVNSITLKNGTLTQCVYSDAEGKLILDGVTITGGNLITNYNFLEITVQGESVFEEAISFNTAYYKPVHLRGGTFENGINISDGELALSLLDDGFAYQSFRGILDASIPENIAGKEIQVVAHECEYVSGKCVCGRTCDHVDTVDDDGYCTFCHALVYPYAIGKDWYKSLEDALAAAGKGDTITLRGDFYQGDKTVEINKNVTLDLGGYTLTGNAEDPVLRVMELDVTIQNGSVENTNTAKSIQAVTVGKFGAAGWGLTVKNANFTGSVTEVTPRNVGLSVQPSNLAEVESGTFTGGIYVEGDLIMTGGSTTKLELGSSQGKAELSGGTFDSINPGNADYAGLLLKGYAYQSGTSLVKLADMNHSTAVKIVKCTHPDGLSDTEECPYCGKTCAHENMDEATGQCPDCGYQVYTAKIDDTLYATVAAALENAEDNQTVTLLAKDTLPDGYTLSKKITLNLNGKTLIGEKLKVTGDVTVSSSGRLDAPMEITGRLTLDGPASLFASASVNGSGTLILKNAQATAQTITVKGSGSFELRGGSIGRLSVVSGTAILHSGRINYGVTVSSGNLLSILAEGKALVKKDGTVVDGTGSTASGNMEIADHTHTFLEDGKCACGASAAIEVTTDAERFFFDDFKEAVAKAQSQSGSTLRLLADVTYSGTSYISIDSGTFTIDWNGHILSGGNWLALLSLDGTSHVTLKDSSGTNAGGARNTASMAGPAVRFVLGTGGSAAIEGGTYSPHVYQVRTYYGPVRISGGVFENPADSGKNGALYSENGTLNSLLAEGYAFAYAKDGSELVRAYNVAKTDDARTVYVVSHNHDDRFNRDGVCDCGYECPHEHWTDGVCDRCGKVCAHPDYADGKCTVCGSACHHWDVLTEDGATICKTCGLVMTVMVQIPNEIIQYTTDLAAALNNAEDGTYITLLDDVVLEKNGDILDGKEVALDMNGHNINQGGRTLNVEGEGSSLIVKGSGNFSFSVNVKAGGQLDMTDWTGTVVNVNLSDACDFVGPTGNGHIENLNIGNWRDGNVGTILLQGGTIGKLWLNSFEDFEITLGSLLKSGYAAKSGSGYLPYDKAIKYVYQGQRENILYNLTIEPCPHTGMDDTGRCAYCGKSDFVASVTKDGVTTGYTDLKAALAEISGGKSGTVKLLKDVKDTLLSVGYFPMNGTLDLNGKKLNADLKCQPETGLRIVNTADTEATLTGLDVSTAEGGKVIIDDESGSILFHVLQIDNGSLADLLPEGCAYQKETGAKPWISAEDAANSKNLGWVRVYTAPVKSVTLTANKTTVTYGESENVTLSTSRTLIAGVSARYAWAEVLSDGTVQTFPEKVDTSFTLPAGVSAGVHTYKVSVTADNYTLSKTIDITVTKAAGTLENKDYPTTFTYGDTVPTPKAENFTANNPTGAFSYYWEIPGDDGVPTTLPRGENPTDAGTYTLHVTRAEGANHTAANLALTVTIRKAPQTAGITVVNETISGKGDGGVTLLPAVENYEYRKKGETVFESYAGDRGQTFLKLTPGTTYEIRLAGTANYLPSDTQEVTVQPGRKLKVTLPENQKGYTLTASKTELDWHENVTLTFKLDPVGAYKTDDFCIWKEENESKAGIALDVITLSNVSNDITISVTGVALDDRAPTVSIQGRQLTENRHAYIKWDGFADDPVDDYVNGDFLITAGDRGSGVANAWYCLSDKPLTKAEMDTASWVSVPLTGTSQAKVSITEDGEYYLYVKVLDKANNPGYACTGKLVKESNPPTFSGVKDGETYYVSRQLEIHDDGMPDWFTQVGAIGVVPNGGNENPIRQLLDGNRDATYTIKAADRCGNEATITVHMKPLSNLTKPIDNIQAETIQKSDRATLDTVEAALKGLDVTYATEQEKKEIQDKLAEIARLRAVLDQVAAVEAQIDALPDSVEPYQQTVEETKIKPARSAYDSLSDHQKTLVDGTKLAKLEKLETQLDTWTITEGDGQVWYRGSWTPLSFTVNGQTRKFDGIRQENTYIGCNVSSLLTVSGEVDEPFTLTLKPEFLQCQTPGEHSFMVCYGGERNVSITYTVETPANYLDVTDREEFNGKTTVTIDGAEYPIEEVDGQRYVNLPENGDLLTIYSFKDGTPTGSYTNYPTGMQVYRVTRQEGGAKAERITEFDNLLSYAGCSIRVSGKKGIRMITAIDQNVKKSLVSKNGLAGYTLAEYGTVVQWADKLGSDTLNLTSGKGNFAYKKGKADPVFAKVDGKIQYTNVLVGFTDAQCQPDLVMRPYIKLKDAATGETVTLYGGCVTRSIGYVAWQNRDTYKPGTASYKYVWSILDAVDTTGYPD